MNRCASPNRLNRLFRWKWEWFGGKFTNSMSVFLTTTRHSVVSTIQCIPIWLDDSKKIRFSFGDFFPTEIDVQREQPNRAIATNINVPFLFYVHRRREQQVLESVTTRHTRCVVVAAAHRITFKNQRAPNAAIQRQRLAHVSSTTFHSMQTATEVPVSLKIRTKYKWQCVSLASPANKFGKPTREITFDALIQVQ